ncbi:protein ROS1-like [Chenopodium quinoa]|uniref:protein ROS1-like n=1 Tax=Chenopodium quinoa TaxID=63459 RepID=UPI000B77F8A4|nr:protein ROS1-like [Chenopodium quinoa]
MSSRLLATGTLNNEEQDESKDEECISKSAVVGPQTPLPSMKKRVSRRGGSLTNKQSRSISKAVINLEEDKLRKISELAEKSVYFTRSINQQVSNAFKLVEVQGASSKSAQLKGHGRRVSIDGKKRPYQKNFKETNRAWKELLKKAIAESCEILMEKDESVLVDDELQLFHEKVHSFASKVGTIQGKRVYFPWKGSVLDSVIGAFLSQRVSDNYSSSAFMSLGVSFPQYRDCDTYSRHHRMLREKRSIGGFSCQKQDLKGGHLKLGPESQKPLDEKKKETLRKGKAAIMEKIKPDWDTLKTQYSSNTEIERSIDALDYVDWHAVRRADMVDISNAIELRGMNKKLAKRIKVC